MTRFSHAAAHRESSAARWAEVKLTWWWRRERLRDWRRDSERFRDDVAQLIASRLLPPRLKYWAAIDVGAAASTGRYAKTVVPELLFVDVLTRWSAEHRRVAD